MYLVDESEYLVHHGIKGQKWGKRNGPPYPLDSDISTGKRLKIASSNLKKHGKLTDKQRRFLKTAAAIGVAAVGTYALYKTGNLDKAVSAIGRQAVSKAFSSEELRAMGIDVFEPERIKIDRITPDRIFRDDQAILNARANGINLNKFERNRLTDDVYGLDFKDMSSSKLNPSGSAKNCGPVTWAAICERLGFPCAAKDVSAKEAGARLGDPDFFKELFSGAHVREAGRSFKQSSEGARKFLESKYKPGDFGQITCSFDAKRFTKVPPGHSFIFEISQDGKAIFSDFQHSGLTDEKIASVVWSLIDPAKEVLIVNCRGTTPQWDKLSPYLERL